MLIFKMSNMKISRLFLIGLVTLFSSCEDFLDISPDSGLKEEEVFSKLANVKSYFTPVYGKIRHGHPLFYSFNSNTWTWDECTECCDAGANRPCRGIRNGTILNTRAETFISGNQRPILYDAFKAIRICNNVIANVDRVQDAQSPEDIYDLKGQAYFVRGYAYMSVCRLWGGMPYLTHVLTSEDEWDRPRLSAKDTYKAIALDMDSAYTCFKDANKVRRDPKPGESGNLNTSYQLNLPNGCAALALKSRALLYAASPLSSPEPDMLLWEEAAKASWEAIKVATENGYYLLPIEEWLQNTWDKQYTNEQLWADSNGTKKVNNCKTHLTGPMANLVSGAYGINPTQNFVDRYETAPLAEGEYGYSLATEEDRNKAIQAGVFDPQNPYANLDKRFYHTIFYNEAPTVYTKTKKTYTIKNQINMWYRETANGREVADHLLSDGYAGYCTTGYLQKRLTGDLNWTNNSKGRHMTDPLFMLSELYLNYAEAANEVGGPDYKVEGSDMSSKDALMVIRNRAQQGEIRPEYLENPDIFRERIKNERCVELAFTGHYYWDSYRWRDAEKVRRDPLWGIDVEKLNEPYDHAKYPTGYKYTRVKLQDDSQTTIWRNEMYYLPFTLNMYYQFKTFDVNLNPYW